jgi:hypothetical protein
MESTKKSSALLIAFLLAVVVGLTALNLFQDKVIEQQRYELHWLVTHSTIRMELPPAKGTQPGQAPASAKPDQKSGAPPAPAATEAAAAVAPNATTAKP